MHVQTARMTDVQVSWSPCNIFIIIIILQKYSLAHTDTVLVFYFAPIKNATWMCSFTRLRTLLLFFTSTCDAFVFKSPPSPFLVALIQLHSNLKLAAASIRTANLLYLSWVRSVPPRTAQLFCNLHIFSISFFLLFLIAELNWQASLCQFSSAIILTLNIKDSSKCKALPVVMNIFGVFWIVVSRKPDKRQKEKSLLCHLCCAGSLTPCRVSSLSLTKYCFRLREGHFQWGEHIRGSPACLCSHFSSAHCLFGETEKGMPALFSFFCLIYLFIFTRDFNLRYDSTLSVTCPGFMLMVIMTYFYLFKELMLRLTDADVRDSLPHGLIWTEKLWRAVTWNNKLNLKLISVLSADQSGDYIYIYLE